MTEGMRMTRLQECLAHLDAALTRKDWATVAHTAHVQQATAERILNDQYYLSDGGYSRIGCSWSTFEIFPTSNSLDAVKENWQFCKELIADVEHAIREELGVDPST